MARAGGGVASELDAEDGERVPSRAGHRADDEELVRLAALEERGDVGRAEDDVAAPRRGDRDDRRVRIQEQRLRQTVLKAPDQPKQLEYKLWVLDGVRSSEPAIIKVNVVRE